MRQIFIAVVTVLCLLESCFANKPVHIGCKGCKQTNFLKNFPSDDLEGVWYYASLYDELNLGPQANCLQIEFTQSNCSTFDVKLCSQDKTKEVTCIEATYSAIDTKNPDGHGIVFIPNFPVKYEVFLLAIERDFYAIFYSCKTVNGDTKYEEYFVLTRNGVIYENDGALWTQILTQNGLDAKKMSLIKQGKKCLYKFESTYQ